MPKRTVGERTKEVWRRALIGYFVSSQALSLIWVSRISRGRFLCDLQLSQYVVYAASNLFPRLDQNNASLAAST